MSNLRSFSRCTCHVRSYGTICNLTSSSTEAWPTLASASMLTNLYNIQVARAAAGALRTLAFKNEENKNQIVECGALPTLVQMLRSDDVGLHYEAVGVIGNLVRF